MHSPRSKKELMAVSVFSAVLVTFLLTVLPTYYYMKEQCSCGKYDKDGFPVEWRPAWDAAESLYPIVSASKRLRQLEEGYELGKCYYRFYSCNNGEFFVEPKGWAVYSRYGSTNYPGKSDDRVFDAPLLSVKRRYRLYINTTHGHNESQQYEYTEEYSEEADRVWLLEYNVFGRKRSEYFTSAKTAVKAINSFCAVYSQ